MVQYMRKRTLSNGALLYVDYALMFCHAHRGSDGKLLGKGKTCSQYSAGVNT